MRAINAPTPSHPSENRGYEAPPCRYLSAKIGISTAYGIPIRLTRPSSRSSSRTGAVRWT